MEACDLFDIITTLMLSQNAPGTQYDALYAIIADMTDVELLEYIDDNYGPISDMLINIIDYYKSIQ